MYSSTVCFTAVGSEVEVKGQQIHTELTETQYHQVQAGRMPKQQGMMYAHQNTAKDCYIIP